MTYRHGDRAIQHPGSSEIPQVLDASTDATSEVEAQVVELEGILKRQTGKRTKQGIDQQKITKTFKRSWTDNKKIMNRSI